MMLMWLGCSFLHTDSAVLTDSASVTDYTFQNVYIAGKTGKSNVRIQNGRITEIETSETTQNPNIWMVPAFIDSHVHFAYLPRSEEMLNGGIAAAVDLAAPESYLSNTFEPMQLLQTGPMVTAVQGYPTQSWGAAGYGIECADIAAVEAAVESNIQKGAGLIKIPITPSPSLSQAQRLAGVAKAHALGTKVVTHAMQDSYVLEAAQANVDILGHTPTSPLSSETIDAWSTRAVITTLAAFGGNTNTINNLTALRNAGTVILYGSDFGNVSQTGILETEIQLMQAAGLSGAEILAAGTATPAAFWGFSELGSIQEGHHASFLLVSEDPVLNPSILASPIEVWINGVKR